MKRIILVLALLLIAAPAWAAVELDFEQTDARINEEGAGVAEGIFSYDVNGENVPRAWAIVVTLDTEDSNYGIDWLWRTGASDSESGYWVTPSNIFIEDGELGEWGEPSVLDEDLRVIEIASLYPDGDPGPPEANGLVGITIWGPADGSTVCLDLAIESVRGGVIDEAGNPLSIDPNYPMCVQMPLACEYPACWDFDTQCNGDTDGDGDVDTTDWPNFRDSFGKNINDHPEAYEPCADFDRDGDVDTADWPKFRDNFGKVPAADCEPGDLNAVYCE
jgi:hypothetical protein